MFVIGFVCGAAATAWLILHREGDLFLRWSRRMRYVARRYHEWDDAEPH